MLCAFAVVLNPAKKSPASAAFTQVKFLNLLFIKMGLRLGFANVQQFSCKVSPLFVNLLIDNILLTPKISMLIVYLLDLLIFNKSTLKSKE
jgi:hypothetical protein